MTARAQVESRRVYSGRILNLDIDRVRFPDGSQGDLEMIRHPGAAAVVPYLSDPRATDPQVLVIKQYRYAADRYLIEVPAGRLDAGEEPVDCARRELLEETGYTAERVELLTAVYMTPGYTDELIHVFLAHELSSGETRREPDEFIETMTQPLSRLLSMVETGEIRDAKTVVALLFAARYGSTR